MSIEGRLERINADLREFQIEFERFFRGQRVTPPDEIRQRIQAELRHVRQAPGKGVAENFMVAQAEARFNSYSELFNRRVRDLEMGGRKIRPKGATVDVDRGVVFGERVEGQAVEALYRGLHRQGKDPRFDLDTFRSYLERQRDAIRKKTGCQNVQFRLSSENGHTKLKAKPVSA
ncbi:MAG: MXAN_5187 C-terminal domain-containing protein [Acidobacteriota bacterium]